MSNQPQATANGENNNAAGFFDRLQENFKPYYQWLKKNWETWFLWISLFIIDPLICYVPMINNNKGLLDYDKTFLVVLLVLYGLAYVVNFFIYVYKFKKSDAAASNPKLWLVFVVFAPLVPVVTHWLLVLILIVKPTTGIRTSVFSIGTPIFFFLYLMRVLGIYKLLVAATSPSDERVKTAVFRILVNLLLYFHGGHLFGGLWYLFAVWRKLQCWSNACKLLKDKFKDQCSYANHRFIVPSGDYTILDHTCFGNTPDTTYKLGIFKDALESRIVETTATTADKLFYCFRWGVQHISGYGQNLEVGTHAWENIFVVVITVYGLATFTFFIGNMQNLLKSSKKTKETPQDLEKSKETPQDLEKC